MNIVNVLLSNLRGGTLTLRFPEQPPIQVAFRGLVENDPEVCIGCGQCAYPCTTGAIEVHRVEENFEWTYEPGKCTFCSRCLDRCPTHALTMQSSRAPAYCTAGQLNKKLKIAKKKPAPRPAAPATAPAKDAVKGTGGTGA
jgi:formate hydrogenlyase subunit 6/NADH:ubiquinone oxidoreductase subunit I